LEASALATLIIIFRPTLRENRKAPIDVSAPNNFGESFHQSNSGVSYYINFTICCQGTAVC